MNREAQITFRAPLPFKALIVRLAKSAGISVADEMMALCYQGLLSRKTDAAMPPDMVWEKLISNIEHLPSRSATAADREEFESFSRRLKEGRVREINTAEALEILNGKKGSPKSSKELQGDLVSQLMAIQRQLEAVTQAAEVASVPVGRSRMRADLKGIDKVHAKMTQKARAIGIHTDEDVFRRLKGRGA